MITMISLLSPCKKIIIDYLIAIYFIPVTHLFCNWKFVHLNFPVLGYIFKLKVIELHLTWVPVEIE